MAGRFSRSLKLVEASWSVVQADKELLWFPVMSAIALVLVLGGLTAPVVTLGALGSAGTGSGPGAAAWVLVLVFYIAAYFVGLFFNTALVGAALMRLDGGDPTVRDGLRIAWARVGRIFGYACIAGTVGLVLRTIQERSGWVGRIVGRLLGVGWALASFLVVPLLVTRDIGPWEAVKESAALLKETWGENIIGSVGLGLVFGMAYFAVVLATVITVALAARAQVPALVGAVVLMAVATFLLLATVHSTLQGVYSAALYSYATGGRAIPGFAPDVLEQAFKPRA